MFRLLLACVFLFGFSSVATAQEGESAHDARRHGLSMESEHFWKRFLATTTYPLGKIQYKQNEKSSVLMNHWWTITYPEFFYEEMRIIRGTRVVLFELPEDIYQQAVKDLDLKSILTRDNPK